MADISISNSVIVKEPYKPIIAIIVIWTFLFSIIPLDFAYGVPVPIQENQETPPEYSPEDLANLQNNKEALIDQKNELLNPSSDNEGVKRDGDQVQPLEAGADPIPGDFDGNGLIDYNDYYIWRDANGSHEGDPYYHPELDLNSDGVIDIQDYIIMAQSYYEQEGFGGQQVGDLNNDGKLDRQDLELWQNELNNSQRGDGRYLPIGDMNFDDNISEEEKGILLEILGIDDTQRGDLDGNGVIDFDDFILWRDANGSHQGDPNHDPSYDLNSDGAIDVGDLLLILEDRYEQLGASDVDVLDFDRDGIVDFSDIRHFIEVYYKPADDPNAPWYPVASLCDLDMNGTVSEIDIFVLVNLYTYLELEQGIPPHEVSLAYDDLTLTLDSGKTVGEVFSDSGEVIGHFSKLIFFSPHGDYTGVIIIHLNDFTNNPDPDPLVDSGAILIFINGDNEICDQGSLIEADFEIVNIPLIAEELARWINATSGSGGLVSIANEQMLYNISIEFRTTIVDFILKKLERNPNYSLYTGPEAVSRGYIAWNFFNTLLGRKPEWDYFPSNLENLWTTTLNRLRTLVGLLSPQNEFEGTLSLYYIVNKFTASKVDIPLAIIEETVMHLYNATTQSQDEQDEIATFMHQLIKSRNYVISSNIRELFVGYIIDAGLLLNINYTGHLGALIYVGTEYTTSHLYKISAACSNIFLGHIDEAVDYYMQILQASTVSSELKKAAECLYAIMAWIELPIVKLELVSNILVNRFDYIATTSAKKTTLKLILKILQRTDINTTIESDLLDIVVSAIPSLSINDTYEVFNFLYPVYSKVETANIILAAVVQYISEHIAELSISNRLDHIKNNIIVGFAISIAKTDEQKNILIPIIEAFNPQAADELYPDYLQRLSIVTEIFRQHSFIIKDMGGYFAKDMLSLERFITVFELGILNIGEILNMLVMIPLDYVDNIAGTNKYGSVNLFLNRWGDPDFWTDWRFSAYRRLLSGIFNHELGHGVDYSGFYPEIDGLFYYLHKISGLDEDNYAEFHSHYVSSPGEDFAETYAQWQSKDGDPSINLFNTAVDLAQTGKAILLEKLLFIMRFFIHQNGPEKSVYFYISTQDDYTAELRPVTMDTLGRITSVNTGDRIIYFTYNNENRLIDVRISYPIYEHDTNLFGDSRVYNVKIFDNGWVRIETPDLKIIEGHLDDYLEFSPSVYWKVSVRGDGSVESLRIYQEKSGGKCLISKRLFNSNNKLIAHFKKMGLSYVEAIIKDYDTKAKTRITIHSQNPGDLIEDLDLDNIDNYQHEEKVVYLYEDSLPFDEIPITSGTDAQWALDRPIITLYYKDGEIKSWHCEVFPEGVFIVQSGADIAELLTDVSGRNPDNINSLIQNGDDIKITLDQTITLPAREVTYDYDCQRGILRFMDTNTWETVAEVEYPEVTVVTIDDRDYEIRITDGIFELEAMFNPFTIEVSTNPYGNKNLTINVDGDYNATVVWSGRTYEAKFAPDAMTIIITNPYQWSTNTEWVFKFNDTPAGYLLESLEMTHESPYGKSITLYKFSEERMEFIDHRHESDNYNSLSHTSYFYDIINEKTLISAIDSYYHYESSYNGIIHTGEGRYKTYYAYDQNGDRTATVHVGNYAYDGRTNRYASYTLFSTDDNTITTVYVYDVDPILLDSINSPSDYEIIDQYAHTKTVAFYEDPSFRWNKRKFSIEYARNTEGEFIAKKVYDKNYQTYIVIGDPDIQSGETSDILIKNWQKVLDDYNVTYGRAYSYDSETGQREYLGYGLVFSKWVESDNGKWKQVSVVVDYPKDDRITLDDKEYLIEIDQNGCVKLTEYIILFEPTAYSLWIDAWRYYKQRKSLIDLLYSDDSEENYLTLKYNIPLVQ